MEPLLEPLSKISLESPSKLIEFIINYCKKTFLLSLDDIIELNKVIKLLEQYPTNEVFNMKHSARITAQQELALTINNGIENKISGQIFLNLIHDFKSNFYLPDTYFIIRKNTEKVNEIFKYCFELMKIHKLKRDQNVYNYAFDNKDIIPIMLNSF